MSESKKLGVAFIGRGDFAQFIKNLIETEPQLQRLWEIKKQYYSTNPYNKAQKEEDVKAVYICTPDHTHYPVLLEVLESRKHVLCEKPCFFSLSDYKEALKISLENKIFVRIDFQRRFDCLYQQARKEFQHLYEENLTEPPVIDIVSKDPVPHENNPSKYLSNSVIHDIDTSVWLVWPFVSASVSKLEFSKDLVLNLVLKFEKENGKIITSNITFQKGNQTYLNQVEISNSSSKKCFKEDFSDAIMFNRYRKAYISVWQDFFKEIQSSTFEPKTSEFSLAHPSFQFTYQLLGDALTVLQGL